MLVPYSEIVQTAWVRWGDRMVRGAGELIPNPLINTSPDGDYGLPPREIDCVGPFPTQSLRASGTTAPMP